MCFAISICINAVLTGEGGRYITGFANEYSFENSRGMDMGRQGPARERIVWNGSAGKQIYSAFGGIAVHFPHHTIQGQSSAHRHWQRQCRTE